MARVAVVIGPIGRTSRHINAAAAMDAEPRTTSYIDSAASAALVQDGASDMTANAGEFVEVTVDSGKVWVAFGAAPTAAVGTGTLLIGPDRLWRECSTASMKISVIDNA